jgi:hypothetical protein
VLVDIERPEFTPPSPDPVVALIWAGDGRAVAEVISGGRVVVRDGVCTTVETVELRARALEAGSRLLHDAGLEPRPRWPT